MNNFIPSQPTVSEDEAAQAFSQILAASVDFAYNAGWNAKESHIRDSLAAGSVLPSHNYREGGLHDAYDDIKSIFDKSFGSDSGAKEEEEGVQDRTTGSDATSQENG